MGEPLHVVDRTLKILSVNRAFREWLDILDMHESLIGKSIVEAFPFLPSKVIDEYSQVFESGNLLITSESTIVDGREVFTETRKIPVYKNGEVIRVVTIIRDVTEHRLLEIALEDYTQQFQTYRLTSEERFSSVFNESPVSICLFDGDGVLTHTNPACTKMFGLAGDHDLLGFDLFKVPDVPDWVFDRVRAGERVDFEWVFDINRFTKSKMYETSKTGIMHIGTIVSPLNVNNQQKGWIVQMQDITMWKIAQLELQRAQEVAMEYMDLMSHDIANHLQSMVICAGLLGEVARKAGKGHVLDILDEAVLECIKIVAMARKMTHSHE